MQLIHKPLSVLRKSVPLVRLKPLSRVWGHSFYQRRTSRLGYENCGWYARPKFPLRVRFEHYLDSVKVRPHAQRIFRRRILRGLSAHPLLALIFVPNPGLLIEFLRGSRQLVQSRDITDQNLFKALVPLHLNQVRFAPGALGRPGFRLLSRAGLRYVFPEGVPVKLRSLFSPAPLVLYSAQPVNLLRFYSEVFASCETFAFPLGLFYGSHLLELDSFCQLLGFTNANFHSPLIRLDMFRRYLCQFFVFLYCYLVFQTTISLHASYLKSTRA